MTHPPRFFRIHDGIAELSHIPTNPEGFAEGTWFYFNRLLVQKRSRGKGVGRQLMEQVCEWADKDGISIYNDISDYGEGPESIPGKIKFYEKFGFTHIEDNVVVRYPRKKA
jgi:GNAT superfamily N-acetyltransferase